MRTVDEVIADYAIFTDEQWALAQLPEPPHVPEPGSDCRPGGSCGLNLNADTLHAQWCRARFRMIRSSRNA